MTLADDSYWHYGYDGLNQITSAVKRDNTGNALPGYTFGYGFDTIGNRESATRETTTETHSPNPLNQIGSIDHAGLLHLLGTAAPSANVTLNAQSVNRADSLYYGTATGNNSLEAITIEGRITGAGHNGTDAVAIVEGEAYIPAGPTARSHDESGNLVEDARWLYTWDAENRLVQIETRPALVNAGALHQRITFGYDSQSRRISKTVEHWDTATSSFILHHSSFYLWDGLTIAEQRSGTNGETVEKRFFPQGVKIVTGANSGTYTYRTDHLGSIREVVDDQGDLTARFDYSPWGEIETVSGNFDLDFGFTGHFIHQPTELYLAPFRAYDAGLGRWLSRDPIEEFGNDGFNLYSYVRNNPINRIDPLGLEGLTVEIGEIEGAGDALERIGRQIEAGDRMGSELANRHQRPGFLRRSWESCKRNARSLKSILKGFGSNLRPKPPSPADELLGERGQEATRGIIELSNRGLAERQRYLANPDCPDARRAYDEAIRNR